MTRARNRARGSERARSASGESRATRPERGRWSTRKKAEVVLRILRGEDLDSLSRELGVTAARLASWREAFLASGETGLKSRPASADPAVDESRRLKEKIGDQAMEIELLNEKVDLLEANRSPQPRRSRR